MRNWQSLLYDIVGDRERSISKTPSNVATGDLFSVRGGLIKIIDIVGIVQTVVETQTNNLRLLIDPENPATDTNICGTLDVTADAVGTTYNITGTFSEALVAADNGVIETPQVKSIICPPGVIELSGSATNTGVIRWSMYYVALSPNVQVNVA